MNQGTAHAPVAVPKRVDRLKLGMCDRSLEGRRQIAAIEEGDQVFECRGHVLLWRGDEVGAARARSASADPVLLLAHAAGIALPARAGEEGRVNVDQRVEREALSRRPERDRSLRGADVRHDLGGSVVLRGDERFRQSAVRDDQALDAGGGDSLGT